MWFICGVHSFTSKQLCSSVSLGRVAQEVQVAGLDPRTVPQPQFSTGSAPSPRWNRLIPSSLKYSVIAGVGGGWAGLEVAAQSERNSSDFKPKRIPRGTQEARFSRSL